MTAIDPRYQAIASLHEAWRRALAQLDGDPEVPEHVRRKLGLGPAHPHDGDRFMAELRQGISIEDALEHFRGREMICNAGFEFRDGSTVAYGLAMNERFEYQKQVSRRQTEETGP